MKRPDDFLIQTARLQLRPVQTDDLQTLHKLFADPHIRRYLLDDAVVTEHWTLSIINQSMERFRTDRCGIWLIESDDSPIGFTGIHAFHDPPELQLLYAILPGHCGAGIATEAAAAVIQHCFAIGQERVMASVDRPNQDSIKVLQRLGMSFVKEMELETGPTLFYEIRRQTSKL